jgi:hypothetical protein
MWRILERIPVETRRCKARYFTRQEVPELKSGDSVLPTRFAMTVYCPPPTPMRPHFLTAQDAAKTIAVYETSLGVLPKRSGANA